MKKTIAIVTACAAVALAPAGAVASPASAPGAKIQSACGTSFGQLVAAGKSGGSAAHGNYAGGANAFSGDVVLAVHGCTN